MRAPELGILHCAYMWRAVGVDGLERGELQKTEQHWSLTGIILRSSDRGPAEVGYQLICDAHWRTRSAEVYCRDDRGKTELRIARDEGWHANGERLQLPSECTDLDLAWSPSTNTLPIRRLNLKIGERSGILTAAWVRLPELKVEALRQIYERTGSHTYIYQSRSGTFAAKLIVDDDGLVVSYEGAWERCVKTNLRYQQIGF